MRAARRFIAHLNGQSRAFERGEEIPAEWLPKIGSPRLVDGPLPHLVAQAEARGEQPPGVDPFTGLRDAKTAADVLAWVNAPDDPTGRHERAAHAFEVEAANRARSTLMASLEQITDRATGD